MRSSHAPTAMPPLIIDKGTANTFSRLDLKGMTQSSLSSVWNDVVFPVPVGQGACLAAHGDFLHVVGGVSSGVGTNLLQVFHIAANAWLTSNKMEAQRSYAACIVHSQTDQLYAIGGDTVDGEGLTIETIQASATEPIVVGQVWKAFADKLGVAVIKARVVQHEDYLLLIGGAEWTETGEGGEVSTVQRITSAGAVIVGGEKAPALLLAAYNVTAVAYGSVMYSFGGRTSDAALDSMQLLDLRTPTKEPTTVAPTTADPTSNPSAAPTNNPSMTPTPSPTNWQLGATGLERADGAMVTAVYADNVYLLGMSLRLRLIQCSACLTHAQEAARIPIRWCDTTPLGGMW